MMADHSNPDTTNDRKHTDADSAHQVNSRWTRLQELFDEAVAKEPSTRSDWLNQVCGEDTPLRADVERLVNHSEACGSFLVPPGEGLFEVALAADEAPWSGRTLGNYQLVERIAIGGMGSVWLAERADAAYEQQVAAKIMHGWLLSADQARRFHDERQALAKLVHPNITRLLDGGTTSEGLPYLVMELVKGKPIHEYCDDQKLGLQGRLRIFKEVCEGVAFAHRNLIIHRDLKPVNILVSAQGKAKLLDFGISTFVSNDNHEVGARSPSMGFTPRYASPEQMDGRPVSTTSDVYSLGVILFELLTGRVFRKPDQFKRKHPNPHSSPIASAVTRAPFAEVPVSRSEYDSVDTIAELRSTTPANLARTLADDLDLIIKTATNPDSSKRYPNIEFLLEDLQRYEQSMPLRSELASARIRTSKFVKRNRVMVAMTTLLTLGFATLLGLLVQNWQDAKYEREVADNVAEVLEELIGSIDPYRAFDDSPALIKAVDEKIKGALPDEPAAQARIRLALGNLLSDSSQFVAARKQFQLAMEQATLAGPSAQRHQIAAMLNILWIGTRLGSDDTVAFGESVLQKLEDLDASTEVDMARARSILSLAHWGTRQNIDVEAAKDLSQQAINSLRAQSQVPHRALARALARQGALMWFLGDRSAAVRDIYLEAVELFKQDPRSFDRPLAESIRASSYCHRIANDIPAEATALREYLAMTPDELLFPHYARGALWRLAVIEQGYGKKALARDHFRRALRLACTHPFLADSAQDASRRKELEEAMAIPVDAQELGQYAINVAELAHGQWFSIWRSLPLMRYLIEEDELELAERLLNTCDRQVHPDQHYHSLWKGGAHSVRGLIAAKRGQVTEAAKEFKQAFEEYMNRHGTDHALTIRAAETIVSYAQLWGRQDLIDEFQVFVKPYKTCVGANDTLHADIIRKLLIEHSSQ